MKALDNFRLGTRLTASFVLVILLLVTIAAIGVNRIEAVLEDTEVILNDRYVNVALAHDVENGVNKEGRALRTALIATDIAIVKAEVAKTEAAEREVSQAIEKLQRSIVGQEAIGALKRLAAARLQYMDRQAQLLKFIEAQNLDDGSAYLTKELLPAQDAYLSAIAAFTNTQTEGMRLFGAAATATAARAKTIMVALSVSAMVLAAFIAVIMTRSVTRPLSQAVEVAQRVASGDLTARFDVDRRDEAGQLLLALQRMNGGLSGIVAEVRLSSDSIATGASQIAAGNADLSQRTEEQAANLQKTTASMEQIAATVNQGVEAARNVASLATSAANAAVKGSETVRQVVTTMSNIADRSKQIGEITGVIDAIATQTNILALNAAIEAARAGEHGREFGVVAGEVRALALRCGEAADEIRALIASSSAAVGSGAELVAGAGTAMEDIERQITKVTQFVDEVDAAAREQAQQMGRIGEAIAELDKTTQQNAALVEQAAAAAESLSRQAQRLTGLVRTFKVA